MNNRRFSRFLLLGLVLILILFTGCGGNNENGETTPTSDNRSEETEEPTPSGTNEREVANIPPFESAQNLHRSACEQTFDPDPSYDPLDSSLIGAGTGKNGYVDGQVVIVGDPDQIYSVVSGNPDLFVNFEEFIVNIDLPLVDDGVMRDFAIRLYELEMELEPGVPITVWEAVDLLNTYIETEGIQYVFAEPNYITILPMYGLGAYASTSTEEISGDACPGCSGGINGDPCPGCSGGIIGDPSTAIIAAKGALVYGQSQFLNQWAFGGVSEGAGDIKLYGAPTNDETSNWTATGSTEGEFFDGNGTQVVVFDTVPTILDKGQYNIYWASVPFNLCVWRPGLILSPEANSQPDQGEYQIDLGEHGLFVTGLAQGVAPAAQYTLIEALNSDGQGDVISLLVGMNEYAKDFERLDNTVFNLSLGLELERNPGMETDFSTEALELLRYLLNQAGWIYDEELGEKIIPSVALKIAMKYFEQEGATIVAAAGNDQKDIQQIPAWFSNVLGVSSNSFRSSNDDPKLSCFSNAGDVGAPGGDGEGLRRPDSCYLPLATLCEKYMVGNIGSCPYVVISIISSNPNSVRNDDQTEYPGFGFWAGTSMSTPLASGLAALVLDKCPNTSPANVRRIITSNARYIENEPEPRFGVIQVGETIAQECITNQPDQ